MFDGLEVVLGGIEASSWGWSAAVAAVVSVLGFAAQTALDHISAPAVFAEFVFFGLFYGAAIVGCVLGIVAVTIGRRRGDWTLTLGVIGITWLLVAQTIQSLWD